MRQTSLRALRHRDFAIIWWSALVSNSGQWMQQVALPFVVYDLTKSNAWLGRVGFASLVPALALTPIAGVVADRIPRRAILLCTTIVQAGVAVALWALWVTGELTPWRIFALSLVSGISAGVQVPSWQSFIPLLVPRESLLPAVRLNSMQFTAARAIGPAGAAAVLAVWGPGGAFLVNAASFALVLTALSVVRPRAVPTQTRGVSLGRVLREGLRYVRARATVMQAMAVSFVISFFGQSLIQLAAGIADEEYGVDARGLSLLIAATGTGAIVASVFVVIRGDFVRRSRMALTGLGFYCVGVALIGTAPTFALGMLGFFINGAAHVQVAIAMNTSIQIQVAEEIRGRVLSIYLMGVFAGMPFGALIGGILGDLVGLRPVIVGYAVAMAAFLVLCLTAFGRLEHLDVDHDVLAEPEDGTPGGVTGQPPRGGALQSPATS